LNNNLTLIAAINLLKKICKKECFKRELSLRDFFMLLQTKQSLLLKEEKEMIAM